MSEHAKQLHPSSPTATEPYEPAVTFTVIAKVESAPGGDVQHMLHIKMQIEWDGRTSDDAPAFGLTVTPKIFEAYELGDVLTGRLSV